MSIQRQLRRFCEFGVLQSNKRRRRRSSTNPAATAFEGLEPRLLLTAPVANDDSFESTRQDTPVDIFVGGNDVDVDGDIAFGTESVTSGPSNGSAVPNGFGFITYTPDPGFIGIDRFTYTINDLSGDTSH